MGENRRQRHRNEPDAEIKRCAECGQLKAITEFYKVGKGYHSLCKTCAKVQRKETYKADKDRQNALSKKYYADRIGKYKAPCVICGESRPACIDFHHIDPATKSFNIGGHIAGHTEDEIDAEMAKCVCICSNCHRDFHHQYGKNPKQPKAAWGEYYRVHKRDIA